MQQIIDSLINYLNENSEYARVLVISFAIIAVLTAAILILRAAVNKKRNARDLTAATEATANANSNAKAPAIAKDGVKNGAKSDLNAETSEKNSSEQAQTEPIGKWIICEQSGKFTARLTAEGETLLTSEEYGSLSGLKSGIDTLKNNIQTENYAINVDKNGGFYFKLFSTANRLLCASQSYPTRERCENAFLKCKQASFNAPVVNE